MISGETTAVRTTAAGFPHHRFQPTSEGGRRAAGGLPAGLLGMLALVAAVETTVATRGARFVESVLFASHFSARAVREKAPGCEVLCLGDSLVKHGLAPRVIGEVTGRRAYNISTPGSTVVVTHALFRRALDAGSRPLAVVFDLKPSMMVGGPHYTLRLLSEALTPREALDLCLSVRSGSFAAEFYLSSYLITYRRRPEIRNDIVAAFLGKSHSFCDENRVCERNWTVNDGANISNQRPGYAGTVTDAEHGHLISHGFFAHRLHAEYARRLVALAADRGIPAYLVLPPFVRDLEGRRRQTGAEPKYEAYVRSLQDHFPGLTVLDARDTGYPPSVFVDPIHLDKRGALALSDDVANVLRVDLDRKGEPPPPKRWVRLPAYRERPVPPDLEDVELSRARLGLKPPQN